MVHLTLSTVKEELILDSDSFAKHLLIGMKNFRKTSTKRVGLIIQLIIGISHLFLLFDISDFQMLIEYGKDLLDLTKKFNSSLALPIMTQVGVCSVLCTITCYATLIIIIRFRALNLELAIAFLGNLTLVRY